MRVIDKLWALFTRLDYAPVHVGDVEPALDAHIAVVRDADGAFVRGYDRNGVAYSWGARSDVDVVIADDAAGRPQCHLVTPTALRQLTYFEEGVATARLCDANTHDRVIANITSPKIGGLGIRAMAIHKDGGAAADGTIKLIGIDGQSLSVSSSSPGTNDYLTRTNPDPEILMFSPSSSAPADGGLSVNNRGRRAVVPSSDFAHLIPALENHNPITGSGGSENNETIALSAAVMARDLGDNRAAPIVVAGFGIGGTSYAERKKGTDHYTNIETGLAAFVSRAAGLGKTPRVREWCLLDGENDTAVSKATWLANLTEFQTDLQDSIVAAIPAQTDEVLLYMHQMGWLVAHDGINYVSEVAEAQLEFGLTGNGVCVGPNYMSAFAGDSHLTPEGYRHLGGYYGKAIAHTRRTGTKWLPLHATPWTIDGRDIFLPFVVPVPPLRFDFTDISVTSNRGINVRSGTTSISVQSVSIFDATTLRVRLTSTPADSSSYLVGVAMEGSGDQGPATGRRSNICDSDATPHPMTGRRLVNYACHQRVARA